MEPLFGFGEPRGLFDYDTRQAPLRNRNPRSTNSKYFGNKISNLKTQITYHRRELYKHLELNEFNKASTVTEKLLDYKKYLLKLYDQIKNQIQYLENEEENEDEHDNFWDFRFSTPKKTNNTKHKKNFERQLTIISNIVKDINNDLVTLKKMLHQHRKPKKAAEMEIDTKKEDNTTKRDENESESNDEEIKDMHDLEDSSEEISQTKDIEIKPKPLSKGHSIETYELKNEEKIEQLRPKIEKASKLSETFKDRAKKLLYELESFKKDYYSVDSDLMECVLDLDNIDTNNKTIKKMKKDTTKEIMNKLKEIDNIVKPLNEFDLTLRSRY